MTVFPATKSAYVSSLHVVCVAAWSYAGSKLQSMCQAGPGSDASCMGSARLDFVGPI